MCVISDEMSLPLELNLNSFHLFIYYCGIFIQCPTRPYCSSSSLKITIKINLLRYCVATLRQHNQESTHLLKGSARLNDCDKETKKWT